MHIFELFDSINSPFLWKSTLAFHECTPRNNLNILIPVLNEFHKNVREADTLNSFKALLDRVDLFIR